jgi:hypothetical protein
MTPMNGYGISGFSSVPTVCREATAVASASNAVRGFPWTSGKRSSTCTSSGDRVRTTSTGPRTSSYLIRKIEPNAAADGKRLLATIDALSTVEYPQTPEQFEQLLGDLQTPDGPLARFVFVRSDFTADDRRAHARVWLRAWPDDRYPTIRAEVQRVVASIDGAWIEFPPRPFPAIVCSPALSQAAAAYLRNTIGPQAVIVLHAAFPFNGEDFALFLQHTPGAMLYLGVANPDAGINGVPHAPDFAADERAIGVGVRAMTGLLSNRLHVLHQ